MGLDAVVYCDCFERGLLRTPPLPEWQVHVDPSGARGKVSPTLEEDLAFDRWHHTACEHEHGILIHRYLGNVATVYGIREELGRHPTWFPTLLEKVVYSGSHAGDFLDLEAVEAVARELAALPRLRGTDEAREECVRWFERSLAELVAAARATGKPMAF